MRAAYGGDTQQVRTLLELGADPNARDGGGRTALYWCASGGHVDAMRALLRAPHPNYTGSLLNFARVLDYAQAGPRKVESTFALFP